MLRSSERLTVPLFKEVMDKGKLVHSPLFSAKLLKTTGTSRYSVAVSKKVAKNAVDRNRIRRRVYSAIRTLAPRLPRGINGVFMAKAGVLTGSFKSVAHGVEEIFVKSGILK